MANLLPTETLQILKCTLCNELLTVPPILTISQDATKHKCGRCKDIETEISSRNLIYEKVAELYSYPCTYSGCKEVLKWNDIEQHELNCVHRTLTCPVSWSCNETISIAELNSHCLVEHRKNVFKDNLLISFDEPLDKSKITVMLFIQNNTSFLVFRVVTTENIWIKVFSFLPLFNCMYDFEICTSADECCLSFKNPVEMFMERKHCKKCIMNDCNNELHKKGKKKIDKAVYEAGFQKIDKNMVVQLKLVDLKLKVIFGHEKRKSIYSL
ncbi:unnamed protein product [Psylliodes chrysocephalus]|uniref:RING-type E3 ubiquitin transferase n=1 Tax=Psylliodes chrysocephalus TaxID=3402493 RepID=A0A9P0CH89_9CUCU|nr:unnamed protein product [Psylliodes chrysocephala]